MAYLQAMWTGRSNLRSPERTGFAQFFYIFINTHVESQLSALIDFRLESIRRFAQTASHDLAFRVGQTRKGDTAYFQSACTDAESAFYSLHKMIDEKYESLKNAPITRLIKIYDSLFPKPVKSVLGEDLKKDLDAVISMRNVFAHGRRISIDFEGHTGNSTVDLDSSTLKEAAKRLQQVNLLSKEEPISVDSYHTWEQSIFSDKALLHFYDSVQQIDDKLKGCPASIRENEVISQMAKLPKLL